VKGLKALIGRSRKSGADSIEDAERFNLTTVGLLVDNNRGVNVSSIFLPVGNLIINELVAG